MQIEQFSKMVNSLDKLFAFGDRENFEYFAVKLISSDNPNRTISTNREPTKNKTTQRKIKNRVVLIFCDSLDLRSLEYPNSANDFPNLSYLLESSLRFQNFTSSGSWTYPVVHSVHTGIFPTYSFSCFRLSPCVSYLDKSTELYKKAKLSSIASYTQMSYAEFIGQPTWKNSLARSLWEKNRIKSTALKNSNNHGWKYGLSLGFDYTIENSPCSYFNADLDSLLKKIEQYDTRFLCVDIDHIHRMNPKSFLVNNQQPDAFELDFLEDSEDKFERLTGKVKNVSNANQRYLNQLRDIDVCLGELLRNLRDDDSIVLFSDHGSPLFGNEYETKFHPESTMVLGKALFPTLLINSPLIQAGTNNDLISSTDIFAIIHALFGLKIDSLVDASTPQSLGGISRSVVPTFGITLLNEKIGSARSFELILRYPDDTIRYFTTPVNPHLVYSNPTQYFRDVFPEADLEGIWKV